MVWAFEVRSDDANIGRSIYEAALARELLLRPIGNTVYFMPPYTITDEEQQILATRVVDILDTVP
jgi:adenosylmethionine---8-amino-7-oxononanoate aminotransferase